MSPVGGVTPGTLDHELLRYGYALLFLGVLVEADAFLIADAFLAHRGYFDIRVVIGLATTATAVANQFWFWLGRWRGRAYLDRRLTTDRRARRIHGWLQRHGTVLIPMSRFLWGFRAAKYEVKSRGGRGRELLQRGQFTRIVRLDLTALAPLEANVRE